MHAINKLHNDLPGLNLAVSLHAPVQDIRCQIMPAARAFPLVKLMDTLQEYQKKRQDFFNSGMLHLMLLLKNLLVYFALPELFQSLRSSLLMS